MLGKLIKYEQKATYKVLTIINFVIILLTLIGAFILNTNIFNNSESIPLAILLVIFYSLSLIAMGIIIVIYLYIRFYKNLFTAEGYLMHTLPVTPLQLFHSKLIVGYFWTFLNSLLMILSISTLGFVVGYHITKVEQLNFIEFFTENGIQLSEKESFAISFQKIFGYTPEGFVILLLILLIVSCFSSLLMGYLSILLGQLVEKYKLAASVGFYIVIYIVNQVISSFIMILPNLKFMISSIDNTEFFISDFYKNLLPLSIITQLLLGIIFYFMSVLLVQRKVNLD